MNPAPLYLWVSTIPTYYETIAVGTTRANAERAAMQKAYEYLQTVGAITPETDSPRKVGNYLGIITNRVPLNDAVIDG